MREPISAHSKCFLASFGDHTIDRRAMLNNFTDFYVYIHEVVVPFTLNNKEYTTGDVVYVGSGRKRRAYSRSRTSDHGLIFDNLQVKLLETNLSYNEKLDREQFYIEKYWQSGLLFNSKRKVHRSKTVSYQEMKDIFEISAESKTGLIWKVDVLGANGKVVLARAGSVTAESESGEYYKVNYKGKTHQAHRVVWCLHNKQDVPEDKVVDHVDMDKKNNNPNNLRLVTHSENQRNKPLSKRNNTGHNGIRACTSSSGTFYYAVSVVVDSKQYTESFSPVLLFPRLDLEEAKARTLDIAIKRRCEIIDLITRENPGWENLPSAGNKTSNYKNVTWEARGNSFRWRVILQVNGRKVSKSFTVSAKQDENFEVVKELKLSEALSFIASIK